MAGGVYAVFLRVSFMASARATNLSDEFPWGIWIGFDVLCGVGLAAGGFTLVATVHIFNIERYKPILRPAILTAFLGYLLVTAALLLDIGRPWAIWHPLVMWNHHSVMFEVAWCVTSTPLFWRSNSLPMLLERLGWKAPLKVIHAISVPLMILGVILSTLHQSSLGTVYLIVPEKMHPLWYSPMLPLFFFVSLRGGRTGNDHFRILAFQPRVPAPTRVAAPAEHGPSAGRYSRFLSRASSGRLAQRGSLHYILEGSTGKLDVPAGILPDGCWRCCSCCRTGSTGIRQASTDARCSRYSDS